MSQAHRKPVKTLAELKPRTQPTQLRAEKTRQDIIRAAMHIIDEQGLPSLTTRRIAAEIDVAIASVYRYFPNKESILYAIIDQWFKNIIAVYKKFDALDTSKMSWQEFFTALDNDAFFTNVDFKTGYRHWALIINTHSMPALQKLEEDHEETIVNYLAKFLKRFGSKWPTEDLRIIGRVIFYASDAVDTLSMRQDSQTAKKSGYFSNLLCKSLYKQCLETDKPDYTKI